MHRPAAVEASPSPEKRGECAHTASRPSSAAARAPVSRSAKSALDKVRVLFKLHNHLLQQTIFECTAALNSMRDGPMGHSFGCGDVSCVDCHQRHVVREFSALFCVVWLSSRRGVRSCGGHRGLGSRLGLLGLFVFRFLLSGFDSMHK